MNLVLSNKKKFAHKEEITLTTMKDTGFSMPLRLPESKSFIMSEILKNIINENRIELTDSLKIQDIQVINVNKIHHYFYNEHTFPFEKKDQEVEIQSPENDIEILDVNNFRFAVLKNDTCIADSLRSNELFEKFLLSVISVLVPKNKNMIDIGANIGIWSIVFSKVLQRDTMIYAFEPQTVLYNCLNRNMILNDSNTIVTYNVALSNENKKTFMNASYDISNNFGAFRIINTSNSDETLLEIDCNIGDEYNFKNIGFIKIDVEGHEYEVLTGLKNTILENMPMIFIEIHSIQENCDETLNLLYTFGYKYILKFTHCDYLVIP
jgi:FkbM family methyltransferase